MSEAIPKVDHRVILHVRLPISGDSSFAKCGFFVYNELGDHLKTNVGRLPDLRQLWLFSE